MVIRTLFPNTPLLFSLFANLYLAGTVIFGGGAALTALLRDYIVEPGWVSPRDFLIGLAIVQALPGPHSNFAVYLGSLAAINRGSNAFVGAVCAFVGVFFPGLIICHGSMGVWSAVRGVRMVQSILRGFHAAATGLVYTAVYRLWRIGYIDAKYTQGTSLAENPWWVVVTATSYVGCSWFDLSPPVGIILGAVMGLIWYGVVSS